MKDADAQRVRAKIIDIISCTHHSGYVRDYMTEDHLWDNVRNQESIDSYSLSHPRYLKDRYEERLYMHFNFDYYVEKDESTNKLVLMHFEKWNNYTLKISYVLKGHSISKIVTYTTNIEDLHIGDNIYIQYK